MDSKQTTNHLLMVRPAHFAFNEETAGSNAFQQRSGDDATNSLQQQALEEFDNYVDLLKRNGVKVTVVDPTIPKKVIVTSPAGTTFSMAQTPTAQLEYTIEPATAADAKVTWTTSNKKYATVDEDGLVTFQGKGKVTITATVIGEKNKKITGKIKLTVNK